MKSISCKEAVHYILIKEEGQLSLIKRLRLWRHLAVCSLCRIFLVQNRMMNESIKQMPSQPLVLSEAEKEEMIRTIMGNRSE